MQPFARANHFSGGWKKLGWGQPTDLQATSSPSGPDGTGYSKGLNP